jgi:hypothetical protein
MQPVAIIEAERPGLDAVILWDDGNRLIAFAYLDGRVTMTRVIGAGDLNGAIAETRENFQISDAQLTRIHDWHETHVSKERLTVLPSRWQ